MKIRHIAIFLILLVCLVGAVSAADDVADDTLDEVADDAVAVDNVQEDLSEDISTEPADSATDDTLQAQDNNGELKSTNENETIATTTDDNTLAEQNNQETLKSGTKEVSVNNIGELATALNNAVNDDDQPDTYIINLNSGTYSSAATTLSVGKYTPNIIINGNNQELKGSSSKKLTINNGCNVTIKDLTINYCDNYVNLALENTKLKNNFNNYGEMRIINNFQIISNGYIVNNAKVTFINSSLSSSNTKKNTNKANLIFINSTVNAKITNEGILTIDDDSNVEANTLIDGSGKIIINDTTRIVLYLDTFNGDYTLENTTINNLKTNYGNLTLRNVTLNAQFTNNGNLSIKNSTINAKIINNGILTLDDDVIFDRNCQIENNGQIIINDPSKLTQYLSNYNGTYVLENITINTLKTNYGNLTLRNVTLNVQFTNNGNLTIENSTINTRIDNYGRLNIADDVIFGTGFAIEGEGEVIYSDISKIIPYFLTYNGDYVLENLTVGSKLNKGNLTIINSQTGQLTNRGNMTIINSSVGMIYNYDMLTIKNMTLTSSIQNKGLLIIDDDVTFGPSFQITGSGGIVIIDDYNKIFKYMSEFRGEATVELGDYNKVVMNYGNLTIKNTVFGEQILNSAKLIIINSSTNTNKPFSNSGTMEFQNSTINTQITNNGILIISEDSILGPNFKITGTGQVITNNTQLIDYVDIYKGDIVLNNKTITTPKTNKGNLTLNNCTINSTISNDGRIIIDENTVFGENAKITGTGEIVIADITKLLPIIDTINGNYEFRDLSLTKNYAFRGQITLTNCTITSPDNTNFGTLRLSNCTVNVGEDNTFLTNYGTVTISRDTKIIGKIVDLVDGVIDEGAPKTFLVTQDTIGYFFDETGLTSVVNPGDTLNIEGTIKLNQSLIINKPVNIISKSKNAYIDLNTTAGDLFASNPGNRFAITKDGAYTNVTGIYFHNTQIWLHNTNHVILDGISAVVEDQRVGSGVGQTSIRENSSYITVKNSYFYTRNNGGSSTLVLAWANYCTIENNTIVGSGNVGNLLYLTTYNVNIPQGSMINSHNKLINNNITGPDTALGICYGICISGYDNLIDNNTINYCGSGIMPQWGSGITGTVTPGNESLVGSGDNIVCNNKLYGGCGICAGDLIYNNYMEGTLSVPKNSKAYNNTANGLGVGPASEVTNNTILGKVTFYDDAKDSIVANNTIKGNIEVPASVTNVTLADNDITGTITLDGSYNKLSNNKITTTEDYAVYSNKLGVNNTLTDNYMVANGKVGADAVSLRDPSNTIQDSTLATTIAVTAPSEATVNKTVKVTIKLMDANGNPITAQVTVITSVGSETVNITNGEAVYQYTPTAIGQDTITVKYAGNTSFYPTSNSANINVVEEKAPVKEPVIKITGKNANVDYGFTYKVLITQDGKSVGAGKQVTLKIAGKTLTAKTDKNGYATFTLAVAPKAYTATVTYNKVSQKYKITVKNVIVAKNAKVKKSAKKPVVKVTLKTSAKKPIAGKKVTIKINGKKVTAKTNKKGVATFNIKKIVKKLKAGKKYKYQVIYGKDTIKKTLKVKK